MVTDFTGLDEVEEVDCLQPFVGFGGTRYNRLRITPNVIEESMDSPPARCSGSYVLSQAFIHLTNLWSTRTFGWR